MLKDFKDFILRGNVVDLAVGLVVGSAFTLIVTSFVKDLITPLIGSVYNAHSFASGYFTFRHSKFMYGDFVNACISFLLVALVVFFFVINKMVALSRRRKPQLESSAKTCPECLSSIPKAATRCMYCTVKVK